MIHGAGHGLSGAGFDEAVRHIFRKTLEGYGPYPTAAQFTAEYILIPGLRVHLTCMEVLVVFPGFCWRHW